MKFKFFGGETGKQISNEERQEQRYRNAERAAKLFFEEEFKPLIEAMYRYAEDGNMEALKQSAGEILDELSLRIEDAIEIYAGMIDGVKPDKK